MADRLSGWLELSNRLEAAQIPLPIIFGHNDLLPANFMDDGDRLWLIDFEYAGFSTAMFDIAGAASNAGMDEAEAGLLLETALGRKRDPATERSFHAMQCASLLRETMWSLVSELHLDAPGVDYEAYTAENLTRFDTAIDLYLTTYGKS
jgi:thiamine kinase-like enzyme